MTAQIMINILFLVILICHMAEIRYLQEENKQLWHNIDRITTILKVLTSKK